MADYNYILMDETLILTDENMYKNILDNIAINNFLILFTVGCALGILCSLKKKDNKYILVETNESNIVKGEIV
jgi:hypothetical protein